MAWEKTVNGTETAHADNADLRMRFYYGDAAATPPNALRVALDVEVDRVGGVTETRGVDVALANVGALTAQEKTDLMTLLGKLRDAGLQSLGFTQV